MGPGLRGDEAKAVTCSGGGYNQGVARVFMRLLDGRNLPLGKDPRGRSGHDKGGCSAVATARTGVTGTLTSWLSPLVLLPWHQSPGSSSSAQEPGPGSRPPNAGCRAPVTRFPAHLSQKYIPPLVLTALPEEKHPAPAPYAANAVRS